MALSSLIKYDTSRVSIRVDQTGHGFSLMTPLYYDNNTGDWLGAQCDTYATKAQGVVVRVINSNSFELAFKGLFTVPSHGLDVNVEYYTSAVSAGQLVDTIPALPQRVLIPLSDSLILVLLDDLYTASVPVGGNTGQSLVKSGDGSWELSWEDMLPLSGGTLTGDLILNADPSDPLGAVTKQYLDNLVQGWKWKTPGALVTDAGSDTDITNDLEAGDTFNGVVLEAGDRVLLRSQSSQPQNGVYVVQASGPPARASDFNSWSEIVGAVVTVEQGSSNADTVWLCTVDEGGTLNTSDITFIKIPTGAGLTGSFTSGQIPYASGTNTLAGSNNLFFNSSDSQLGVGVNTFVSTDILRLHKASGAVAQRFSNGSSVAATPGFELGIDSSSEGFIWNRENKDIYFGVNNTKVAILSKEGNWNFTNNTSGWFLQRSTGYLNYGGLGSDPVAPLHLRTSGGFTRIKMTSATTGHGSSQGAELGMNDDGDVFLWTAANTYIRVGTNNVESVRFEADGHIHLKKDNAEVRFSENSGNGSSYTSLKGSAALDANRTIILPGEAPTDGYIVKTNSSGQWSYVEPNFAVNHTSLRYYNSPGRGSTNTTILRWTTAASENVGTDLTYVPSSTLGDSWTVNVSGTYSISGVFYQTSGTTRVVYFYIGSSLQTNVVNYSSSELRHTMYLANNYIVPMTWIGYIQAGDKICVACDANMVDVGLLPMIQLCRVS